LNSNHHVCKLNIYIKAACAPSKQLRQLGDVHDKAATAHHTAHELNFLVKIILNAYFLDTIK